MSAQSLAIVRVSVDPDVDKAGTEIARALRQAADYAETHINIVAFPGGEWNRELHDVAPGVALILPQVP